jgi:hypothetical protein
MTTTTATFCVLEGNDTLGERSTLAGAGRAVSMAQSWGHDARVEDRAGRNVTEAAILAWSEVPIGQEDSVG